MPLDTVKREVRVAFSKTAQPIWFRIAKWVVFVGVARRLYGTRWFWICIAGGGTASIIVHLLYRSKTQGWTQPWGGWNDQAALHREQSH